MRALAGAVLLAAGLIAVVPWQAAAQQRPLLTGDPRLVPEGEMVLENGIGYFNRVRFPVSGIEGNQLSLLTGGAYFGLGSRAEFQLTGTLHNIVWVDNASSGPWGNRANDWGDGTISTKVRLLSESGSLPDVSFQPSIVLPNASNESGLGTDGTHFFARLLVGKSLGRAYIFGNVGLGILDNAVRAAAQQDVLVYGLAAIIPVAGSLRLALEVNGLENRQPFPALGGEDRGEARLGFQWHALGMDFDVAATGGLSDLDHRYGFVAGTSKRFTLWQ